MLWPVVKSNKVIFKRFLVFSQSDGWGLALGWNSLLVQPRN